MALEVLRGSLLYCASVRGWGGGGTGLWASRCLPAFVSSPPGKELHQGSTLMLGEALPFGCLNKLGDRSLLQDNLEGMRGTLSEVISPWLAPLICHLTPKPCITLYFIISPHCPQTWLSPTVIGNASLPEEVPCSPEKWWYNNPSPRLPFCIFGKISSGIN